MLGDDAFKALMVKARKRVARMDRIDGHPQDLAFLPRTAALAIESGVKTATKTDGGLLLNDNDLSCILDAVVYCEQMQAIVRDAIREEAKQAKL